MSDDIRELKEDVKEVKTQLIELIKSSAIQNVLLEKHERRSTNLEDRFKPIEDSYVYFVKAGSTLLALAAVTSAFLGIYRFLH